MLTDLGWDRRAVAELVKNGLSVEHAKIAIGVIAEERMNADHVGYCRGFNNGHKEAAEKIVKPLKKRIAELEQLLNLMGE